MFTKTLLREFFFVVARCSPVSTLHWHISVQKVPLWYYRSSKNIFISRPNPFNFKGFADSMGKIILEFLHSDVEWNQSVRFYINTFKPFSLSWGVSKYRKICLLLVLKRAGFIEKGMGWLCNIDTSGFEFQGALLKKYMALGHFFQLFLIQLLFSTTHHKSDG